MMTINSVALSSASEALDNVDDIWGSNNGVLSRHQWTKMEEDFTNAGYREGITTGKESALQEGFDDGFDVVGAPLGREVGILRGIASAILSLFSSMERRSSDLPRDPGALKEELQIITQDLGRIHLADLAPRDVQAEEHAREHMDNDVSGEIHFTVAQDVDASHGPQAYEYQLRPMNDEPLAPPAVEELQRLRVRLSDVLKELGLDIPLD